MLFTINNYLYSQSIVNDKNNRNFQELFFAAITENSIGNYQNAIDKLNECDLLIPNNKVIFFLLSKNYYKLNKNYLAIEFGKKALTIDPKNIWFLENLIKIYKKYKFYNKAIDLQKKNIQKHSNKKSELVYLLLKNNDIKGAKKILNELSESKMLNYQLRQLKNNLEHKKTQNPNLKNNKKSSKLSIKELFKKEKSFSALKRLLTYLDKNNKNNNFLKYSNIGISLFPAQPLVYLMKAKALNKLNKPKNSIDILLNGIDFIVDDEKMLQMFYIELVKSYEFIGDDKNVIKYKNKIK